MYRPGNANRYTIGITYFRNVSKWKAKFQLLGMYTEKGLTFLSIFWYA